MKTPLFLFLLVILTSVSVKGQSTNFRAQGNYYSAKEEYESRNYNAALDYVYKAKKALGGTNTQLQYIHVMAAYHAEKYAESKNELETFFKIQDNNIKAVSFDRTVDPLTNDEVKEITKIIDKVDESLIAKEAADRAKEAADKAATQRRASMEAAAREKRAKTAKIESILVQLNRQIEQVSGVSYIYENKNKNYQQKKTDAYFYVSPFSYSSSSGKYSFEYKHKENNTEVRYKEDIRDYTSHEERIESSSNISFKNFLSYDVSTPNTAEEATKLVHLDLKFSDYHQVHVVWHSDDSSMGSQTFSKDYSFSVLLIVLEKDKPQVLAEIVKLINALKELEG